MIDSVDLVETNNKEKRKKEFYEKIAYGFLNIVNALIGIGTGIGLYWFFASPAGVGAGLGLGFSTGAFIGVGVATTAIVFGLLYFYNVQEERFIKAIRSNIERNEQKTQIFTSELQESLNSYHQLRENHFDQDIAGLLEAQDISFQHFVSSPTTITNQLNSTSQSSSKLYSKNLAEKIKKQVIKNNQPYQFSLAPIVAQSFLFGVPSAIGLVSGGWSAAAITISLFGLATSGLGVGLIILGCGVILGLIAGGVAGYIRYRKKKLECKLAANEIRSKKLFQLEIAIKEKIYAFANNNKEELNNIHTEIIKKYNELEKAEDAVKGVEKYWNSFTGRIKLLLPKYKKLYEIENKKAVNDVVKAKQNLSLEKRKFDSVCLGVPKPVAINLMPPPITDPRAGSEPIVQPLVISPPVISKPSLKKESSQTGKSKVLAPPKNILPQPSAFSLPPILPEPKITLPPAIETHSEKLKRLQSAYQSQLETIQYLTKDEDSHEHFKNLNKLFREIEQLKKTSDLNDLPGIHK